MGSSHFNSLQITTLLNSLFSLSLGEQYSYSFSHSSPICVFARSAVCTLHLQQTLRRVFYSLEVGDLGKGERRN